MLASTALLRRAEAILASAEFDPDPSDESIYGLERVQTGFEELDEALDGGLRRGKGGVVSICGEGRAGREIANSLLATHLVSRPGAAAAVVDTTGAFSVVELYDVLLSNLKRRDAVNALKDGSQDDTMETRCERTLERVEIMRAFDIIGVREAVEEIKESLEELSRKPKTSLNTKSLPVPEAGPGEILPQRASPVAAARREIADSEEEEDDDEMLMDPMPETKGIATDSSKAELKRTNEKTSGVEIIIIDNIGQVVSPAIKSNYVQAHAFLTSFLQTLNHLATTHKLLIILFNNALTAYKQPQTRRSRDPTLDPPEAPRQFIPSSIFASNTVYPALGQTFPYFLDVVLLISNLPSRERDARLFYAENERRSGMEMAKGVKMETVVEVLQDRFEGRVGRWATLRP